VVGPLYFGLQLSDPQHIVDHQNIKLDLSRTGFSSVDKYRFYKEYYTYEKEEYKAVNKFLNEDLPVIELGAGTGFISCVIDEKLNDKLHVAVEANPKILDALKEAKILNNSTFTIHPAAYTSSDDDIQLNVQKDYRGSSAVGNNINNSNLTDVSGTNLKSLIDKYDIDEFSLVCDIEGSEIELLISEFPVLYENSKTLIIEFHEDCDNYRQAKDILSRSGFRLKWEESNVEVWE
jgi:FkbM family methyltransferase